MKIVYTGGTFDMLHEGHINLLKRCKELGRVVVALNTDEFAAQYKRTPVIPYEQRRQMLLATQYVDVVVKNAGGKDSGAALDVVCPDVYVHGDDWTGKSLIQQLGIPNDYFDKYGIWEVYIPYTKGISTSEILERVKSL